MTDNVENLVLEHLRALRSDSAETRGDLREIKARLSAMETSLARVGRDTAQNFAEVIEDRHRVDALRERIERIERGVEPVDQ